MRVHPHSTTRWISTLLVGLGLTSVAGTSTGLERPESQKADADYVIVTTLPLLEAFEALAQHKRDSGTSAVVVAVEQIEPLYAQAADLAEAIREFLIEARAWWGTEYVLLGGDVELVPARSIPNLTGITALGDEITTDLYFAALDGDWNADGDAIIGEYPDDLMDLEPELRLGRAPVSSSEHVETFVAKTIFYQQSSALSYRGRGLTMASEYPGITETNQLMVRLADDLLAAGLAGAAPTPYLERRYGEPFEWPGWESMEKATAIERLNSGNFGWVLSTLFGDTEKMLVDHFNFLEPQDFAALENGPNYFVMIAAACYAANFIDECALETLMKNPNGGAVAGLSHTGTTFLTIEEALITGLLQHALSSSEVTLGEAMNLARTSLVQSTPSEIQHVGSLSWTLLGDPQLRLAAEHAVATPSARGSIYLEPNRPNPFNPSTELRYGLPHDQWVELLVFDARGRQVATLVDRFVTAGEHVVHWNGRDAAGARVGSGVYFARLRAGDTQLVQKMVLVE